VNLKEAAARLGVHYQTAYRWVRAGELGAVRVGARYEVSDAAIHQFVAGRTSVLRQAVPRAGGDLPASGDTPDDVLQDLEAMAGDPLISLPSLTAFAARRGREALGDLCLVAVTRPDGTIERAAVDHPHADRAAFFAAALSITGPRPPRLEGMLGPVLHRGDVVRIPHVPQDRLRAGLRPELRQYLVDHPILGVLGVPMVTPPGTVSGIVMFSRETAAHPYSEADEAFAVEFAARVCTLVTAAREITAAWTVREELADRFRAWLVNAPIGTELDPATVRSLLDAYDGPALAAVVYDADGCILGANTAVEKTAGYDRGGLVGRSFVDIVDERDIGTERANFARLASGELDYHDLHADRRRSDGTMLHFAMHRVAVRRLDASLACVVSVGRPVRITTRVKELFGDA
jgi:excisionase family DNA binding protein/PAS domain S-box-containing protein